MLHRRNETGIVTKTSHRSNTSKPMIGETILAGTSARYKQINNRRNNISLMIGLQSAL